MLTFQSFALGQHFGQQSPILNERRGAGTKVLPKRPGREKWTSPQPISIDVDGVRHTGRYQLELPRPSQPERGFIRVTYGEGEKKTHLGGLASTPEAFARFLLSEIVGIPPSPRGSVL